MFGYLLQLCILLHVLNLSKQLKEKETEIRLAKGNQLGIYKAYTEEMNSCLPKRSEESSNP